MFNVQARAAAGFSKMASIYGRQWETCLDGEGNAVEMDAPDAAWMVQEFLGFDREDGNGAHTEYRIVAV